MASEALRAEALIVEVLGPGLVRVGLANGYRLLAHTTKRSRVLDGRLVVGNRLTVEMSPFDLSVSRIIGELENNLAK
ncbi:MAG: translation initiation factor IF-1 [Pedosphaera sp.]|nr:translation initiation factor IF-1 [Pedosphaera sp.]